MDALNKPMKAVKEEMDFHQGERCDRDNPCGTPNQSWDESSHGKIDHQFMTKILQPYWNEQSKIKEKLIERTKQFDLYDGYPRTKKGKKPRNK